MTTTRRAQGFSLLEVLITAAILSIVMGAIYASLHSGSKEYEVNSRRAWSLHQARLAIDELSEEIRQATRLSMLPAMPTPNAPSESAPTGNVSFKKVLPSVGGVKQETVSFITYKWVTSGETTVQDSANGGATYPIPGSTWIDANGNGKVDEGMLVRIDPNPDVNGRTYPVKILCNYVKDNPVFPAGTPPQGFKVSQSVVTVNGEKMLQVHITLLLQFTDSVNKVQEQTVESKVFVRNLQ